jgi:arylsulfatase A
VVSEPICGTDILPTICDLLEIPVPDDRPIDGVSFLPIFEGKPIDREIPLHWEFHHPWSGPQAVLREGNWVLTAKLNTKYPYSGGFKREFQLHFKYAQLRKFKLYNLAEDIGQQNDIAYAYPERVENMAVKLDSIYQEVHEEGPWW